MIIAERSQENPHPFRNRIALGLAAASVVVLGACNSDSDTHPQAPEVSIMFEGVEHIEGDSDTDTSIELDLRKLDPEFVYGVAGTRSSFAPEYNDIQYLLKNINASEGGQIAEPTTTLIEKPKEGAIGNTFYETTYNLVLPDENGPVDSVKPYLVTITTRTGYQLLSQGEDIVHHRAPTLKIVDEKGHEITTSFYGITIDEIITTDVDGKENATSRIGKSMRFSYDESIQSRQAVRTYLDNTYPDGSGEGSFLPNYLHIVTPHYADGDGITPMWRRGDGYNDPQIEFTDEAAVAYTNTSINLQNGYEQFTMLDNGEVERTDARSDDTELAQATYEDFMSEFWRVANTFYTEAEHVDIESRTVPHFEFPYTDKELSNNIWGVNFDEDFVEPELLRDESIEWKEDFNKDLEVIRYGVLGELKDLCESGAANVNCNWVNLDESYASYVITIESDTQHLVFNISPKEGQAVDGSIFPRVVSSIAFYAQNKGDENLGIARYNAYIGSREASYALWDETTGNVNDIQAGTFLYGNIAKDINNYDGNRLIVAYETIVPREDGYGTSFKAPIYSAAPARDSLGVALTAGEIMRGVIGDAPTMLTPATTRP